LTPSCCSGKGKYKRTNERRAEELILEGKERGIKGNETRVHGSPIGDIPGAGQGTIVKLTQTFFFDVRFCWYAYLIGPIPNQEQHSHYQQDPASGFPETISLGR
jgi:hypothetical protein